MQAPARMVCVEDPSAELYVFSIPRVAYIHPCVLLDINLAIEVVICSWISISLYLLTSGSGKPVTGRFVLQVMIDQTKSANRARQHDQTLTPRGAHRLQIFQFYVFSLPGQVVGGAAGIIEQTTLRQTAPFSNRTHHGLPLPCCPSCLSVVFRLAKKALGMGLSAPALASTTMMIAVSTASEIVPNVTGTVLGRKGMVDVCGVIRAVWRDGCYAGMRRTCRGVRNI